MMIVATSPPGSPRSAGLIENNYSRVSQLVDQTVEGQTAFHHFTQQGHVGEVLALATSTDVGYIISGGVDGTMRVWWYDEEESFSYQLHAVIRHNEKGLDMKEKSVAVTAVACAGEEGPAISGTDRGDLNFLCLSNNVAFVKRSLHEGKINDLSVVDTASNDAHHSAWLLGTAGEDRTVNLCRVSCVNGRSPFTIEVLYKGLHVNPVLEVIVSPDSNVQDHLCGCSTDAVYLWGPKGRLLAKVAEPEQDMRPLEHIQIADDWSLLMTLAGGVMCAWDLDDVLAQARKMSQDAGPSSPGESPNGASSKEDAGPSSLGESPNGASSKEVLAYNAVVARYDAFGATNMELGTTTRTKSGQIISMIGFQKCEMWSLSPSAEDGIPACGPTGLASRLVKPGEIQIMGDMVQKHRTSIMKMALDPDDGEVLITGNVEGDVLAWDIFGHDAGEKLAELRSVGFFEMVKPFIMVMIAFAQLTSFGFGKSVPYPPELDKARQIARASQLEGLDDQFHINKEAAFWVKSYGNLVMMFVYMGVVLLGVPSGLTTCIHSIEELESYQDEFRSGRTYGPSHLLRSFVQWMGRPIKLLIFCCSTILVVPMSKALAEAMHCVHEDGSPSFHLMWSSHEPSHVAMVPSIPCYHGRHRYLYLLGGFGGVLYLLLLIPYALVAGDVTYVQRSELFSPRHWRKNAERYATLLHKGPMHPKGKHAYVSLFLELIAKITMPVLAVLLVEVPREQMLGMSVIAFVQWSTINIWPPFVEHRVNVLMSATRLMTLLAMLCGWWAVELDDPSRTEPLVALGVCVLAIPIFAYCRRRSGTDTHNHLDVVDLDVSNSELVHTLELNS